MGTAVVGVFVIAAFAAMGALERFRNGRALRRMPLRVNVNGIRGKSTVTRLVTAILAEEGYNVVGKTTGTAARMIYGLDREEPIVRKPEGANIKEQVVCIDKAARHGANAMVCECMAVRPEYQTVVQERMLRANVCVIVNILEDHLDVMGPTELQIAEAFSKSIPRRGYCVTVPGPYLYVLERECVKRGSELVVVDESEVPEEYIARFPYEIFPANVALAIGVARVLGISREVAERGALLAKPDPGAAQIVDAKDNDLVFVNGFAANEPSSSWTIWDRMESKGATEKGVVVLFNGRPDRIDRTQQFVEDFFPRLPEGTVLFCMGQGLSCVDKARKAGRFPGVAEYRCFEGASVVPRVLAALAEERYRGWCVYGIGNIHGEGASVISAVEFGFDSVVGGEAGFLLRFAERLLPWTVRGGGEHGPRAGGPPRAAPRRAPSAG